MNNTCWTGERANQRLLGVYAASGYPAVNRLSATLQVAWSAELHQLARRYCRLRADSSLLGPLTSQLCRLVMPTPPTGSSTLVPDRQNDLSPRQRDKCIQFLDKRSGENGYTITPLSVLAYLYTLYPLIQLPSYHNFSLAYLPLVKMRDLL
ncbi:unnamed protein product [Protopolystoma xenopodis]|uniref:Uncharacterized protein n=1 Tax=Protopolystoma xenopodis TaxID=117903 RepID=A0A3S5B7Q0_9PLAT|nr:unnamed protein product [Protopolystoma xenopodis]